MASKTLIELIDDLDGSPAAETVTFAVDGVSYEIDLNEGNAAQLREAITTWADRGRRTGGRRVRGTSTTSPPRPAPAGKRDLAAIRAWAKDNGHKVSDRGRVPQAVLDAYDDAN